MKDVDLGEPTPFLDHVYLGCTQRECQMSKDIVDNYRTMFESRISAEGTEKLPYSENMLDSFGNREKGLFLSVYVDDIKLAGKKQNISPTWKYR